MTALNFPDSPSNGDTYQGYTYNSTKGTWAKPDSPDPDARTAVYANIATLPTSGTAGDMAYVTATNRLYIWTGTGWYNIALINNNPTISGVSSSYALAIDGTATTVTITATDPEGLPITYSIVSDTSGNAATVAQGTGSSTNVFTITPSTNTAHAGTFSLTFRASDGVNIASSAASFTLQFKVVNQKYTTALITSVGANNAVNTSFDDKSTNDHTITTVGDAHQTTFSPYRHGGYSMKTVAGSSLGIPASTDNQFTGDFTIEGWVYSSDAGDKSCYVHGSYFAFNINFGTGFNIYLNSGGASFSPTDIVPASNEWNHVALVRSGSTVSVYLNGVASATTGTNSATLGYNSIAYIGGLGTQSAGSMNGYISDFRVVNGTAVYTSNFTPPTERLTAATNTSVLTCHLPYIADGSTNNHAITINGNTKTAPFAPYDAQEYSASSHLGSAHFDGSGDYLHMPQTSLDLGSDNFCVEAWVYTTSTANQAIIGSYRYADGVGSWNLNINYNSNKLRFFIRHSSGTVIDGQFESGTFPTNQWVHVAVTRDGSNLRAFINGTQAGTTNTALGAAAIDNAITTYRIGAANDNNIHWNGNIADARVVKGSSVYTADFTPTTVPLTAITNTIFLAQSTDAGIIDKAQTPRFVKLLGNTKSSTTQTKFLSSSMYFDGTGDYIEADDQDIGNFGSGDFTAEGWFYLTASPSNYITIAETRGSGGSTTGWVMAISAGDFYVYSGASIGAKGSAISSNTWYHWAFTRSGTDQKVFLNGTQTGTTYTTVRNYTDNNFTIGAKHDASEFFTGYQSDVRITKGLARYTADFTAPTAALKG